MTPSKALEKSKIVKPVAVAVEGLDYLYTLLGQIKDDPNLQDVQLWDFQGADDGDLERWLELFATLDGFEDRIRAIGIIRDAEQRAADTLRSTARALKRIGLPAPARAMQPTATKPSVGVLIMPHDSESGCLEHAILEASERDVPLDCAESYLECVGASGTNENWNAKVKVHALIAAGKNPAWTLSQSLAAGLWDFAHPSLRIMTDFMRLLCRV
jgi:hypothetical protein